jgi:hypothetical protein
VVNLIIRRPLSALTYHAVVVSGDEDVNKPGNREETKSVARIPVRRIVASITAGIDETSGKRGYSKLLKSGFSAYLLRYQQLEHTLVVHCSSQKTVGLYSETRKFSRMALLYIVIMTFLGRFPETNNLFSFYTLDHDKLGIVCGISRQNWGNRKERERPYPLLRKKFIQMSVC